MPNPLPQPISHETSQPVPAAREAAQRYHNPLPQPISHESSQPVPATREAAQRHPNPLPQLISQGRDDMVLTKVPFATQRTPLRRMLIRYP